MNQQFVNSVCILFRKEKENTSNGGNSLTIIKIE